MFQFLIGTLQTKCCSIRRLSLEGFQFLIGTLQTLFGSCTHLLTPGVSIPYRYATNLTPHSIIFFDDAGFQFLIGTLQTDPWQEQALRWSGFQFLIGTLQTKLLIKEDTKSDQVSIPYRYATNETRWKIFWLIYAVSIPYRYATNCCSFLRWLLPRSKFQFLIGTLQTKRRPGWLWRNPCFNSL